MEKEDYLFNDLLAQNLLTLDAVTNLDTLVKQKSNLTIAEFYSDFCKMFGQADGSISFFSPGFFIGSLYMSLVVPQKFIKSMEDTITLESIGCNSIAKKTEYNLKKFVTRIRNSLSHERFVIDKNYTFTFNDENMRKKEDTFCITLTFNELYDFNDKWIKFCIGFPF